MSPSTQSQASRIEALKTTVETTLSFVQTIQSESKIANNQLLVVSTNLDNLKTSVDSISKIVKDGNGESLVTKVALLEQELEDIRQWLQGIEENDYNVRMNSLEEWKKILVTSHYCASEARLIILEQWKAGKEKEDDLKKRGKWEVRAAIIAGLLGSSVAMILLLKELIVWILTKVGS